MNLNIKDYSASTDAANLHKRDFNMSPQTIIDSGFPKLIKAIIETPDTDSTSEGSGIIDFAMHSPGMVLPPLSEVNDSTWSLYKFFL